MGLTSPGPSKPVSESPPDCSIVTVLQKHKIIRFFFLTWWRKILKKKFKKHFFLPFPTCCSSNISPLSTPGSSAPSAHLHLCLLQTISLTESPGGKQKETCYCNIMSYQRSSTKSNLTKQIQKS